MFKGAFGAGFSKGFGTTLAQGIEDRRERREKYIDLGIDNAKKTAVKYSKANAQVEQTAAMLDKMKTDFKLSNEEVALIAQNHDVSEIYKTAYTNREVLKQQGLNGDTYTREALLGGLKLPESFSIPEAMSVTDIVKKVMIGTTANALKNRDNSEAGRSRNLGSALSHILMLNPQATAKDALAGMTIGGYDVSELQAYEATEGVPQTPFDDVAGTSVAPLRIEYDDDQAYQTNNRMRSLFTKKFTGYDDFDSYTLDLDAKLNAMTEEARASEDGVASKEVQKKDLIVKAGSAAAKFELQLLQQGLTDGMNTKNARTSIMTGIVSGMSGDPEDLKLFVKAVGSGDVSVAQRAVEMHKLTVEEGMRTLTEDEVDYILMGKAPQGVDEEDPIDPVDPVVSDNDEQPTKGEEPVDETPVVETVIDDIAPPELRPDDLVVPKEEAKTVDEDGKPIFEEPSLANLGDLMSYYAKQDGVDLNDMSDENRDARQGAYIKAQKELAGLITYDEWKEIKKGPAGSKRLREMGLPTTVAEAAALGLSNFKDPNAERDAGVEDAKALLEEDIAQRPEPTDQDGMDMVQEERDVFNVVVEDAVDSGMTFASPEAAEKFVKSWFRDNVPEGVYDDETLKRLQKGFGEVLYKNYTAEPVAPAATAEELQVSPDEFSILESVKGKG